MISGSNLTMIQRRSLLHSEDYYLVNTMFPNSGRGSVCSTTVNPGYDFLSENLEKTIILTGDSECAHRPIDLAANDKVIQTKGRTIAVDS